MFSYNPYQNYQPNNYQPQPTNNLIRVTGVDGAKAYQMGANSSVALFDANADMFYVKSTDGAGFPTIRTFKFEEVVATQMPVPNNDYVSRKEMEDYVKQLISATSETKLTADA